MALPVNGSTHLISAYCSFIDPERTDNHASTPPLSFLQAWMPFLPPNQQRQSTDANKLDRRRRQVLLTLRSTCHGEICLPICASMHPCGGFPDWLTIEF